MKTVSRPVLSAAVVAAALALGYGAGELLSRWNSRENPDKSNERAGTSPAAAAGGAEAVPATKNASLSAMHDTEFRALQSELRNTASGPAGMIRTTHDLAARITEGLKDAADCARAAALIDGAPVNLRHTLTQIIFRRWATLDPAAALKAADGLKDWQSQRRAAELVLKSWAQHDAAAALRAAVSAPPGFVRERGTQFLLYSVVKDDPARGLQLLSQLPKPDPSALSLVLNGWTAKDPQAAWAWVEGQNDPARREQGARAVLGSMATNGQHSAALDLARKQQEGRVRRQMVSGVMESWIRKDPREAISGAAKLTADEFTPEMAHSMVRSAFSILNSYSAGAPDPKAWANSLITQFPPGPQRDAAQAAIAVHVLTFNLGREFQAEEALPLLNDMPDGPWKARATADLAALWTHTDAVAASEWLAGLPPSSTRDAAVARFVERIALSDPERARQWAETIQTPPR